MAIPRSSRPADKQQGGPSSTLIIIGSVLVGFLLVAVWVVSTPAAIPEETLVLNSDDTKSPVETLDNRDVRPTDVDETEKESASEETVESDTPVVEEDSPSEESETVQQSETPVVEEEPSSEETVQSDTPVVDESSSEETVQSDTAPVVHESEAAPTDAVGTASELTTETQELNTTKFETQVQESNEAKGVGEQDTESSGTPSSESSTATLQETVDHEVLEWKLCSFEGAQDYIPCLDNKVAIKKLPTTAHYEHRERHCPTVEELPQCLLPLPANYKVPIKWPASRDAVLDATLNHFV